MNFRQVHFFDDLPKNRQVDNITGLVYSPKAKQFLVSEDGSTRFEKISPAQDFVGSIDLSGSFKAINTAFDPNGNRLLALNPSGNQLIVVAADASGNLNPNSRTEVDVKSWGVQNARGLTVTADGTLYILDGAAKEIVRVVPANGSFSGASVSRFDLPNSVNNPRGIAFDSSTNRLHILSPNQKQLYEINPNGTLVTTRNLSGFDLKDPQALVFAPSGDSTDPANRLSLYVADSHPTSGGIVELSLTQALTLQATITPTLVQTIDASQWNPPSPDSAGIAYIPASNRLLVADSEVNEIPTLFTGDNLFESSLSGTLTNTGSTIPYSDEPTGVDINPANGHLFVSDDTGTRSIYEINPVDGVYGNANDILVNSFNTAAFGSDDPEGVTFAPGLGHLFIADGVDNEVYRVTTNGTLVSQFDTASLGVTDPEGIVYNPDTGNLYIVGNPEDTIAEVTVSGTLVNTIDIGAANANKPAGLAYGPSSQNPAQKSIYVAARGVDNNVDPNENDGKIYEFALGTPPDPPDIPFPGLYFSNTGSGSVGGVSFADEDIIVFDDVTGTWSTYFDGSDVGLTASGVDVDAFYINGDGSILLSVDRSTTLPNVGAITDADIVKFVPTTVGSNTSGTFEWYLDGSDVGLDSDNDDIDAISFAPDGRLVVSTRGSATVPGGLSPTPRDEDLLAFTATQTGANTSGTWQFYFDGSDVGLTDGSEDVSGLWIDPVNNDLYLTTSGAFAVPGVSGDGLDILRFDPTSLGGTTNGTFSQFFDGGLNGLTAGAIDGFARIV